VNVLPQLTRIRRGFACAALIAFGVALSAQAGQILTVRAAGSAASATSLTSSRNPVNKSDSLFLTVTVTDRSAACVSGGSCVSPTGEVLFAGFDDHGNTPSINLTPRAPGVSDAGYDVTTLIAPGTQTLTALYQGDGAFATSQGSFDQTVFPVITTEIGLSEDSLTSNPGYPVTFTATVSSYSEGPPDGQVQFYDGGNPYGGPTFLTPSIDGTAYAQLTTTTLSGTETFVARYLADSRFDTSVSGQISHSVVSPSVTVSFLSTPNPAYAGQNFIDLDVIVRPNAGGASTPTGTVTVYVDGSAVEQGTLGGGVYTVDIVRDIGYGDNYVTANYYGDSTYPGASSGTLDQVLNQESTTTSLSSSANPAVAGQSVTLSSTTVPVAPGTVLPSGTISFYDQSTFRYLAVVPLDATGHAAVTTALSVGTHPISAIYSGDAYSIGSSSSVKEIVTPTPSPTITSVAPNAGPPTGGQTVTITGTNFTGATAVIFRTTAATSFTVVSSTTITATTPAEAAGVVHVQVTTPGGASALVVADHYTYEAAPTITLVAPNGGPPAGGVTVTITGTNFTGATAVIFRTTAATSFKVVSSTRITATTPAGAAGVVHVRVTTPGGASALVVADHYTYEAAPTITLVAPNGGPVAGGVTVTITGSNFTGATGVNFRTTAATSFTVVSSTEIIVTTPAEAAGLVHVRVATPSGMSAAVMADWYTFT
jgi:IPT/TIG domain/Bacterial Ig-like domain (group 3)